MTYLEAVNEVLVRLRESQVATVTQTAYSSMIGVLVNDTKRQVEDSWEWACQDTEIVVTTVAGTTGYTVVGSGTRQKAITVNNTSIGNQAHLHQAPIQWIKNQQQLTTVTRAAPCYYAWSGTDGTDSTVEFFSTPDGIYTITFNLSVPQSKLTADTDVIRVPAEAVVLGAYARALAERGEDGAMSSSEAYGLFKGSLSDSIALEQARNPDYDCWVAN